MSKHVEVEEDHERELESSSLESEEQVKLIIDPRS